MQNPPPPPPSGGYTPPPPPPGGYPPPPPPPGGFGPPPPQAPYGGYPAQAYPPQASYGGFWIRFVAAFIDGLIVSIPVFILAVIIGIIAGVSSAGAGSTSQSVNNASAGTTAFIYLISFVITVGYFVYFWGRGQTLAMRLFRLRVADANTGQPIGYGRAALRYVGYVISALVCYIGLIWAAFDSRKQGWHDKIASTVVLQG